MTRNGTNAKMFGAWSGLSAEESTKQVLAHLKTVAGATAWPKLKKFIGEVDEPVVVIGSCKAIQALQILDFNQISSFQTFEGSRSRVLSLYFPEYDFRVILNSSWRTCSILRNFCFHSAQSHLASKKVQVQQSHFDLGKCFSCLPRQLGWGRDSTIGSGNTRGSKGQQAGASQSCESNGVQPSITVHLCLGVQQS